MCVKLSDSAEPPLSASSSPASKTFQTNRKHSRKSPWLMYYPDANKQIESTHLKNALRHSVWRRFFFSSFVKRSPTHLSGWPKEFSDANKWNRIKELSQQTSHRTFLAVNTRSLCFEYFSDSPNISIVAINEEPVSWCFFGIVSLRNCHLLLKWIELRQLSARPENPSIHFYPLRFFTHIDAKEKKWRYIHRDNLKFIGNCAKNDYLGGNTL